MDEPGSLPDNQAKAANRDVGERTRVGRVDVRRAGVLAAIAIGLQVVLIFSVVLMTRKPATPVQTTGVGSPNTPAQSGPMEPTPSIADIPLGARTGQARVRFMDKADPGREASRLEWQRLDPKPNGEAVVEQPRGFVYLRDGSLVVINAKLGTFFTPKGRAEPESGRFEGGVKVEVFDPVPAVDGQPARPINISTDSPSIIATTKSLLFNAPEAEISTTDAFLIETDKVSITGAGALVVFDQVDEGISRAEFAKIDDARIWPNGRPGLKPSNAAKAIAVEAGGHRNSTPAERGPDVAPARKRIYRLGIDDDVSLVQGPRKLLASRVEAWLTLVNNRLPEGAIGQLGPSGVAATPAAPAIPGTPEVDPAGQMIVASWKGRMVLTPAGKIPDEFGANLVALRLMGGASGPVRVLDEPARLAGEAPIVEYGASSRALVMRGSAGRNVVLAAGGAGTLVCTNVKADLPAGTVEVVGAGELDSAKADGSPALSATWNEGLTLKFKQIDGWIEPLPISAMARGNVQARGGNVVASGQMAELEFEPLGEKAGRAALKQLVLTGTAKAVTPRTDGQAGSDEVTGNVLTLSMKPGPTGSEVADRLTVRGTAKALARGLTIEGEEFVAELTTDARGRTTASKIIAIGKPRVSDASGLAARADRIEADPATGTATLTGSPVSISRDGATMTGSVVRLDQREQLVFVDGPGRISADNSSGTRKTRLEATWQTGAKLDGKTGRVEAQGQIAADINVGDDETNTARGDALTLVLDLAPSARGQSVRSTNRQLKSVEVSGKNYAAAGGTAAQLQHRTYAVANNQRALTRLVYLEGATINASAEAGTLTVPGPGKLLVDDRSAASARPAPAAGASPLANLGGGKGRSLFTWAGSFEMNRFSGRLQMSQQVQLTHRPAGIAAGADPTADQVLVDCNQLEATLRGVDASNVTDLKADLSRVEASGSVRAVTDGRELIAERLMFDAQAELMQAVGTDEQLVTFVDPAQPAPIRARAIEWNLREKRINTEGVAPIIIAPR